MGLLIFLVILLVFSIFVASRFVGSSTKFVVENTIIGSLVGGGVFYGVLLVILLGFICNSLLGSN